MRMIRLDRELDHPVGVGPSAQRPGGVYQELERSDLAGASLTASTRPSRSRDAGIAGA